MERKQTAKIGAFALMVTLLCACSKSDSSGTTTVVPPTAGFTLDLGAAANAPLLNVGGSINHSNINIVHTSSGFVAFSALCTHEGCVLGYNSTSGDFQCPCDAGMFDISGNVLSGPATVALPKYTVTQSGNILTVN